MAAESVVRARIDAATKKRAQTALDAMGLSISDAIRLLMLLGLASNVSLPSRKALARRSASRPGSNRIEGVRKLARGDPDKPGHDTRQRK